MYVHCDLLDKWDILSVEDIHKLLDAVVDDIADFNHIY